jgi:hypothetical protein
MSKKGTAASPGSVNVSQDSKTSRLHCPEAGSPLSARSSSTHGPRDSADSSFRTLLGDLIEGLELTLVRRPYFKAWFLILCDTPNVIVDDSLKKDWAACCSPGFELDTFKFLGSEEVQDLRSSNRPEGGWTVDSLKRSLQRLSAADSQQPQVVITVAELLRQKSTVGEKPTTRTVGGKWWERLGKRVKPPAPSRAPSAAGARGAAGPGAGAAAATHTHTGSAPVSAATSESGKDGLEKFLRQSKPGTTQHSAGEALRARFDSLPPSQEKKWGPPDEDCLPKSPTLFPGALSKSLVAPGVTHRDLIVKLTDDMVRRADREDSGSDVGTSFSSLTGTKVVSNETGTATVLAGMMVPQGEKHSDAPTGEVVFMLQHPLGECTRPLSWSFEHFLPEGAPPGSVFFEEQTFNATPAGSFVQWHQDPGGGTLLYVIRNCKGAAKLCVFAPPMMTNISRFSKYVNTGAQSAGSFVACLDGFESVQRMCVQAGDAFFIPVGWFHSVFTLESCWVLGPMLISGLSRDAEVVQELWKNTQQCYADTQAQAAREQLEEELEVWRPRLRECVAAAAVQDAQPESHPPAKRSRRQRKN